MDEWLLFLIFLMVTGFVLRPHDSTGESWIGYWWRKSSSPK